MCECVFSINEALATSNARVAMALQITEDLNVRGRVVVATEKIDNAKRKALPVVVASFCPFCGEKAVDQ